MPQSSIKESIHIELPALLTCGRGALVRHMTWHQNPSRIVQALAQASNMDTNSAAQAFASAAASKILFLLVPIFSN